MKNVIIQKYGDIISLKQSGYSTKEIRSILFKDLSINHQIISNIVHRISTGKIFTKFNKLIYLKPVNLSYEKFSIAVQGAYITLPNAPYNSDHIINLEYLMRIADPVTRIKLKWLTKNFQIPDKDMLKSCSLNDKQIIEINNIPNEIEMYFNNLYIDVKKKYAEYYFKKDDF
ncbi:MAG: hypothetical protein K2P99_01985 [Burkholderiales bacterium]|nr:hypothetical protein [Burkholderiales bacterium]